MNTRIGLTRQDTSAGVSAKLMMRVLLIVVSVAAVTAAAGCSGGSDGPAIRADYNGDVFAGVPRAVPNHPLFLAWRTLCSTGGPVKITSVTATVPTGGMRVLDWGTRYLSPQLDYGSDPGAGRDQAISSVPGFGHNPVTAKCADQSDTTQFDVTLTYNGPVGSITGVTVHWSGGSTFAQYDVRYCASSVCPDDINGKIN